MLQNPNIPLYTVMVSSLDPPNIRREDADSGTGDDERLTFCRRCGSKIPIKARFCPFCGAGQELEPPPEPEPHRIGRLKKFVANNTIRIRVTLFVVSIVIFISFLFIGGQTHLSGEEANQLLEEYREAIGASPTFIDIAANNILISLLLFIPLLGSFLLAFVGYNTGIIASALALTSNSFTSFEILQAALTFPWTWLEISAYGLASAQSVMLLLEVFTHNLRRGVKYITISLAISLILLVSAAILEASFIA